MNLIALYSTCFSYGLDVTMDRVDDVLLHQKILAQAEDPEKRPVFHVRFVEVLKPNFYLLSCESYNFPFS